MNTLTTDLIFTLKQNEGIVTDNDFGLTGTGDNWFIFFAIIALFVVCLTSLAFLQKKHSKNNIITNQLSSIFLNKKTTFLITGLFLFATLSFLFLSFFAFANADENVQLPNENVPKSVNVYINEQNNSVSTDELFLCNFDTVTNLQFKSIEVFAENDSPNSYWTIKYNGNIIYNKKQNTKITFDNPILLSPSQSQTMQVSTDMNIEDAKKLLNEKKYKIKFEIYQNYQVNGRVIDANDNFVSNQPVDLVSDSGEIINSSITDTNGFFTFKDVEKGTSCLIKTINKSTKYSYTFQSENFVINKSETLGDLLQGPAHDNLKSYTIKELKYISKDFSDKPGATQGTSSSQYFNEFGPENGYINNGLNKNGYDNATEVIEDEHWSIDSNNRIAIDPEFGKGDNVKKFEFRIIGINQDYTDKEKSHYAGLTFMSTHSIFSDLGIFFHENTPPGHKFPFAKYGWEGDDIGGKCTLNSFINDNPNCVPSELEKNITWVYKEHGIADNTNDILSSLNKLWIISLHELSNYSEEERPYYAKEGNYYLAFQCKNVKMEDGNNQCLFKLHYGQNFDKVSAQNGIEVHMRTLFNNDGYSSLRFDTFSGMLNLGDVVNRGGYICPCFCL